MNPLESPDQIQAQIDGLRAKRDVLRGKEMGLYNSGASRASRTRYTQSINSINADIEVLQDAKRAAMFTQSAP